MASSPNLLESRMTPAVFDKTKVASNADQTGCVLNNRPSRTF